MITSIQLKLVFLVGTEDPPGTVSIWSLSLFFFVCPLNLVLYMPFRIFAYSSNILKTNFDLMQSMPVCGTLKQVRLSCKSPSSRDLAPAVKLFCFTVYTWNPIVRCRADFMGAYWVSDTCFARLTYWSVTQLMSLNSRMTSSLLSFLQVLNSKSVWSFVPQSVYRDCFLGGTSVAFSPFCFCKGVMVYLRCGSVFKELH